MVVLSFAVYSTWSGGGLLGQPPAQKKRVEEEEETPKAKKPKRKEIQVEEEEGSKAKSNTGSNGPAGPATSDDLAQRAEQTAHPALKALYRSLAVPHDVVLLKRSNITVSGEHKQREYKIEPTPFYLGKNPGRYQGEPLQFKRLTKDGKPEKSFSEDTLRLESVRPYEEIAQDKVRQFLHETYDQRDRTDPLYLSRYDMLDAAEKVLKSVLRQHDSFRSKGQRKGDEWNEVEKKLRGQLLDEVLLKKMKMLARAKEWEEVLKLTRELTRTYSDPTERERILKPVADMISSALNNPTATDENKQKARERLHELEMEFPDNPAFQPLSEERRKEAQRLVAEAKDRLQAKDDKQARELLRKAEQTWPQLPELRKLKSDLNNEHPILRVGVRGTLPKYFSPALACTDTEHRIVDMLFESLVKLVPDEDGGFHYLRGLSESPPKVLPLGRQFQLPVNAAWSDDRPLNSTDIERSLAMLQNGTGAGLSRVWGDLLFGRESKRDPFQVTLRLKQGFLDPLAPMSFKILPRDKLVYSMEFARNPVTSGPFLLDRKQGSDEGRECLFFVANPHYGSRPTKRNAPHIQEIRFYSYTGNDNIAADLGSGKLDLVLDLTAKEAEGLLNKQNADIEVPMPLPTLPNRRIYFLAINTRKLAAADLRQAISCAIDREALLNKHFRASLPARLHKALNGPFPVGSWASKDSPSLYNRETAKLLKQQQAVKDAAKDGPYSLKYALDDPALDEAMKELCSQVKELTGVELKPTPCDPYKLREDVEQTKNYDLAYYHYDFPDQSYWLAPLFGPPPSGEDINNIFKFQTQGLSSLLEGTKSYRDFATFRQHQWLLHDLLNREMPFVPLWQLDPLLAYRREVKPASLDPLLPFSNIEEWRLRPK